MPYKIPTELSVEWIPTDQLSINPSNPRVNDQAVEHVAASIRRFGWRRFLSTRLRAGWLSRVPARF